MSERDMDVILFALNYAQQSFWRDRAVANFSNNEDEVHKFDSLDREIERAERNVINLFVSLKKND